MASTSAAAAVDPIVIQSVQETKRILADSQVLASDVRQVRACMHQNQSYRNQTGPSHFSLSFFACTCVYVMCITGQKGGEGGR